MWKKWLFGGDSHEGGNGFRMVFRFERVERDLRELKERIDSVTDL